jgi:hypothetical protein
MKLRKTKRIKHPREQGKSGSLLSHNFITNTDGKRQEESLQTEACRGYQGGGHNTSC